MALLHVNFFSESLGMSVACDVILPQRATKQIGMAAEARQDKHPVLWLLHGASAVPALSATLRRWGWLSLCPTPI